MTALCPGWVRTEFHERAGLTASAIPDRVWVDADRCVAETLADAEKGRVISVPTKRWKIAQLVARLVPRALSGGSLDLSIRAQRVVTGRR